MPGYHTGKRDLWQILVTSWPTRLPTSLYLKKLAWLLPSWMVWFLRLGLIPLCDTRHEHHVWYQQIVVGEPWIPELL